MGNLQVTVGNLGPSGVGERKFEANAKPLATTTAGMNFDKSNDFSVPVTFKNGDSSTQVFLKPEQVDAIKMALAGASRNEVINGGNASVSVNVNGQTLTMNASELQAQLAGRGALTAGS